MLRRRGDQLLFTGSGLEFPHHPAHPRCDRGDRRTEFGLDVYPNQIEIITAEQMLDAYSSVGMPLFYKHWSFGKQFAHHEARYRKGMRGLAYEIVINSNPCISYIMEENTATMQTLVIAHAAFGHNHFFKNNYLFKQWTDADGILQYLDFAKGFIADCEERYGQVAVERLLDAAHSLMSHGVHRYPRKRKPDLSRGTPRARAPNPWRAGLQRPVAHGAGQWQGEAHGAETRSAGARCSTCRRRTSSTFSKRPRRACSPGSARSSASSASSRNISTRKGRPR